MEPDLEMLRRRRAEAWRKAVAPYVRDLARSGFPTFVVLAALAALSGYTAFLETVPPDFPITAVGAVVMALLLVRSPLRTHLRPADAVFLMPREHEMERYMKSARRGGYISGSALMLAAWLIYAPLYGQSGAPTGTAALVPALLVLKALNDAGAWRERRMARSAARRLCRLLRAALTLAAVYALFTEPLPAALGFAAAAAALYAAVCRLPAQAPVPVAAAVRRGSADAAAIRAVLPLVHRFAGGRRNAGPATLCGLGRRLDPAQPGEYILDAVYADAHPH